MTEPIPKTEATAKERANYLEAGLETEAALEEAIRLLGLQHGKASDPESRRRIRSQLLQLEAERSKTHADLISFLSETFRLAPPTTNEVNEIKDAARVLYSMVAENISIAQVMEATEKLLVKWSQHKVLPLSA